MIRLEIKNCHNILTEKKQKCQHYHLENLKNMHILQAKKYCILIKNKQQNKQSLHILRQEKLLKNKQKRLKSNEENKQLLLQNERLVALANEDDHKDGHKSIYKEVFDKLFKEKFDEIK